MSKLPPVTSAELAAQAGLNERYVREWLGAMTTARVVEVDSATLKFSLPSEHGAFLARAAAADNIGVFAQYIGIMGGVEDDIVECFRNGGGVPGRHKSRRVTLSQICRQIKSGDTLFAGVQEGTVYALTY